MKSRSLPDPFPDSGPDPVNSVGFSAHEPEMSAGNGQRRSGYQRARAGNYSLCQTLLQGKGGFVP